MSKLTVVKIGTDTPAGAPFTMNRYVNASGFKLVINGTGTNIFELTTGALGATRRFAFAASGQYAMDAYGVGAFTGTATKWLAVTAAGLVIEEAPPGVGTTYTFSNYITESGGAVKLGGAGVDAITTLTADEKQILITFNSLAGTSGLKLTSTSTAATGGLQKVFEIALSGVNATSGQTTYGLYSSNTHSGATSTNYAGYFIASGGTDHTAVYGQVTTGRAISGVSTGASSTGGNFESVGSGGIGVFGQANVTNGIGVWGSSTNIGGQFNANPTANNTLVNVVRIFRTTSTAGSPANGIGGSVDFYTEASDNSSQLAARIGSTWTDVTLATRTGDLQFWTTTDADSHKVLVLSGQQSTLLSRDAATNETHERYSIAGVYKALTESSATSFVRINIPSGTVTGGQIIITVEANDATDYQSRTLRFIWSAVNKAGTITATVQTPEEAVALSAGTLSVTIDTNDAGSGNLDFRANAVSSLTQTILRCSYHVFKNIGTGVITPQ